MARQFSCFHETAQVGDDALRAVAAGGQPEDRALACWRLMTRGQAILTLDAAGPEPEIRRLLLLNFAACGEIELLETVAQYDPDPATRIEALVWLQRVAPERLLAAFHGRLGAETDAGWLRELLAAFPTLPWGPSIPALERLLEHPDAQQRRQAAELLLERVHGFPEPLRRATRSETDRELLAFLLARWAASVDHPALVDACAAWPAAVDTALEALRDVGRRYPFEALSAFVTPVRGDLLRRLIGPPFTDAARRWVLEQVKPDLGDDARATRALQELAAAFTGAEPEGLDPIDVALVQLLGAAVVVPWTELRGELEHWLASPVRHLRALAAAQLLRGRRDVPPKLRAVAIHDCDLRLLMMWAASDDHAELVTAAAGGLDPYPAIELREAALTALVDAGRTYPWETLTHLAAAIEAADYEPGELWRYDAAGLLVGLVARPLGRQARQWIVRAGDLGLLASEAAAVHVRDALGAVPPDLRTVAESDLLARLAEVLGHEADG